MRLGEGELSVSANIDNTLFGTFILAIDNANAVSVEEAYLETLSLPYGFALKGGRFFSGIGYLNQHHRHSWDFADAALPYRAFLSNQYRDDGVQVRWVAPLGFLLEAGAEVFGGRNYPFNGGHTFVGSGGGFLRVGDDIAQNMSYRIGASHLRGRSLARSVDNGTMNFAGLSSVSVLDGVFKWAPTGKPAEQHVRLPGELMLRHDFGGINGVDHESVGWGWCGQAVWRFLPSWEVGVRADSVYVDNWGTAVTDGTTLQGWGQTRGRQSLALTYYTSKFGRFRVQGNRDWSSGWLDHQLLLQYTVSLGAHGAHKY